MTLNKNILPCALSIVSSIVMAAVLSGCMKSNAATKSDDISDSQAPKAITENTLKVVNAAFYQSFIGGEWRYKGAKNQGGSINAYIQIPRPLDMNETVQKNYLQKVICPSAEYSRMWNEIEGTTLSVHLYTHKQKHSVYAHCTNPLKS